MTRGEMIQAIRDDASDNAGTIAETKIERYLNRAARWVQRKLILNGRLNAIDGSVTITADGSSTDYTTAVTDPIFFLFADEVDASGIHIARACEVQADERYEWPVWDADRSCWRFWTTRAATTGIVSINFLESPPAGTLFTFSYAIEQADIVSGGGGTALRFTKIPLPYDELIVARATLGLFGPDSSLGALAAANLQDAIEDAGRLTASLSGYNEVIRDG